MAGEATPTPAAAPAPTGPVKVDALNPSVVIPVYLGGEPIVMPPAGGDRGDVVAPPAAAPAASTPSPLPQGTVAAAVAAETAGAPAAASPVPGVGETANVADSGTPADPGSKPAEAVVADPAAVTPPAEATPPQRNEKGQFIPRARFNEVNEERKALLEENTRLKAEKGATAQVTEDTYDFDAAEREHANLVLDGKVDEAVKKRGEIRAAERAQFLKDAQQTTVETTKQLTVKDRIQEVTSRYETVPQCDPENEAYSEELMADVRAFYAGALDTGRYPDAAQAFEASIQKALKLHGIEAPGATPAAAAPAAAAPAAAAPATPAAPARTAEKRVQAIVNQPPSLAGVGTTGAPETSATIDVKAISEKDLAALPIETRKRLRGDYV